MMVKRITTNDKTTAIKIWDTGGQEGKAALDKSYFLNADGILFVFDITNKSSFRNIPIWVQQAKEQLGDKVTRILVGNKNDLV